MPTARSRRKAKFEIDILELELTSLECGTRALRTLSCRCLQRPLLSRLAIFELFFVPAFLSRYVLECGLPSAFGGEHDAPDPDDGSLWRGCSQTGGSCRYRGSAWLQARLGAAAAGCRACDAVRAARTGTGSRDRHARYKESWLSLTALGEAILARRDDFSRHNQVHRWWGGTELTNDRLWRWDPATRTLIAP